VGEGGSSHSGETGEGFSPRVTIAAEFAGATPHPALRATFSHKGRRKEVRAYFVFLALAFFALAAFFSTLTMIGVLAAIRIDRA